MPGTRLVGSVFLAAALAIALAATSSLAQVSITATAGNLGPLNYTSLQAAFNAINAGTHQGAVRVSINNSTTEPSGSANLNSSGAGAASYTSVTIQPAADSVTVTGSTASGGNSVIQLNGADNVVIDGDNPNTSGINRNLTIRHASSSVAYKGVIRIATSAATPTADNITIRNVIVGGSAVSQNTSGATSPTSIASATFGIYAGGNGGSTATSAPAGLSSTTANPAVAGTTINNLVIANNEISTCGRAIVFNGASTSVSTGVTIANNVIGTPGNPSPASPPFTSPTSTVYVNGIWATGTAAVSVTGNTLQNIMSYVTTTTVGIQLLSPLGQTVVSGNTIGMVVTNSTSASSEVVAKGIWLPNAPLSYSIASNRITNVQSIGRASGTCGIEVSGNASNAAIEGNTVAAVYNRGTSTVGVYGLNFTGDNVTIRNNMISDVRQAGSSGGSFDAALGVFGVRVAGGTNLRIYHNSVNVCSAVFPPSSGNLLSAAFGMINPSSTGCDVRNNVFANTMTGGTASSAHVPLYLPTGVGSGMNLTLDHNAYDCGSDPQQSGLAQVGTVAGSNFYRAADFDPAATTPGPNLRSFTSQLSAAGTNDSHSLALVGFLPYVTQTDLHVLSGAATVLESRGANGTGVTSDFDGQIRPGPPNSVNGGGYASDLGADEFDNRPIPTLAVNANPVTCAASVRFIATVAAGASGSMQFTDGATVLGTAPVVDGYSTLTATALNSGVRAIGASYGGDGQHPAGVSDPLSLTVTANSTQSTMLSNPDPVFVGIPVTLSATVSPSTVTGSIDFLDGGQVIGTGAVQNGSASTSVTFNTSGSHTLQSRYNGDACYTPSLSPSITQDVHVNVFLASNANPSACGAKVELTAALPPGSTGTIDFREGGVSRGTIPIVNARATLSLTDLVAGSHAFVAVYSGDATHPASSSDPYAQMVNGATTTTSLVVNPGPNECSRTLIATLSPSNAADSVRFTDGGVLVGVAVVFNGVGAVQRTFARGQHVFKAAHNGSGCNLPSESSPKTVSIGNTPSVSLTSDRNPTAVDQKVTLIARITPSNASGTVTFLEQGQTFGASSLVNGVATLSRTFATPGNYLMTARYEGDSCNLPSQSPVFTQGVVEFASSATLTSNMNPLTCGNTVRLTATVTPTVSEGTVTFKDGTTILGVAGVANGSAFVDVHLVTLGSHSLVAAFSGTATMTPSTSPIYMQGVAPPWIADPGLFSDHTPRVGEQVVLTAFVNPTNSPGDFEFLDGSVSLGYGPIVNGQTSITVTFNRAGRHFLRSVYSGNDCIEGQTSDYLIQVVNPAATQPAPAVATATRVFQFAIDRITPNPVRRAATIDYGVANTANLRMRIVDVQGRVVETLLNGPQRAGQYQVRWNARGAGGRLPAGIYFVRYEVPGKVLVKRFVLQ